jgi:hypothetical protein
VKEEKGAEDLMSIVEEARRDATQLDIFIRARGRRWFVVNDTPPLWRSGLMNASSVSRNRKGRRPLPPWRGRSRAEFDALVQAGKTQDNIASG